MDMPFNNRLSSDKLGKVSSWNLSNTSKLHEGLQHWIRKTHAVWKWNGENWSRRNFRNILCLRLYLQKGLDFALTTQYLYQCDDFIFPCCFFTTVGSHLKCDCTLLVIICGRFLYLNVWDSAKLQVCCDSCLLCRVYHYEKLLGT
jgi:hypothetical protein